LPWKRSGLVKEALISPHSVPFFWCNQGYATSDMFLSRKLWLNLMLQKLQNNE
jgi:hypothetical protein